MKKRLVRIATFAYALSLALPIALIPCPALGQSLAQPLNNANSLLDAAHSSGSGILVLKTGEGARFGNPTPEAPIRVTVASRATLINGQITATTAQTIFRATGRTGDTLTGLTAIEGTTDRNYQKNDPVASLITAGTIKEIQDIASTIDADVTELAEALDGKANDDEVVKLAGSQTITGKTFASASDSAVGLVVQANSAGQTGDLLQVKDGSALTPLKVDKDGVQVMSLANTDRVRVMKVKPKNYDPDYPADFNFNFSSHYFEDIDSYNNVFSMGHNDHSGGAELANFPVFRDAWENNYLQGGYYLFERHIGAVRRWDGTGEYRPITFTVATRDENGDPIDPYLIGMSECWGGKSHLTEDGVQRQKWEWNSTTSEWNQFSPGSAVYLNPTVCSASFGENGRSTTLKLQGSGSDIVFYANNAISHGIQSVSGYLYVNNNSGNLAYWTPDREFVLSNGPLVARVTGADPAPIRFINDSAPGGAGHWGWFCSNTGRTRFTNLTSGFTAWAAETDKLGFYGTAPIAKPEITGNWADGSAAKSTAQALAALGLVTNSATDN